MKGVYKLNFQDMKKLLLNYPAATKKIYGMKKEIEMARAEIDAIRESVSTTPDGMPRGNAVSDPTYKKAEKIIDKFEKRITSLLNEIDGAMEEHRQVTDLLRTLEPDEYNVLEARYIDGMRWDYISMKVNISRRQCFYLHDKAIAKILKNF